MSLQSCAALLESRCKDKQLYKINKISKKNNFYYTIYQHYIFTKKTLTLLVFFGKKRVGSALFNPPC